MSKRILSLGTIAVDTMLNVDALPKEDGFGHVVREQVMPGGSSANVSVALHELGNTVYQAGKVSDDTFGTIVREDLKRRGIGDEYLVTEPGGASLHTYIVVDKEGKHFILANSGNRVMNLEKEEIPDSLFENIDIFYTDMASPRAGLYIAEECNKRGIPVVFNLQNPPMETIGETKEKLRQILRYTSLFITGKTTICITSETEDQTEAIEKFVGEYKPRDGYICTCGTDGADWFFRDNRIHCGIVPVKAVDTTGAGDAYIAGIIHAFYSLEQSREESMRLAAEVAALKCTQFGPRIEIDSEALNRMRKTEAKLYR